MDIMILALLQGRLLETASHLQKRLRGTQAADSAKSVERELHEVEQALARLRSGRYGLCDSCAVPLEPDQLLTKPTRLVCQHCDHRWRHTRLH
jgi:RNA polymerase-binding transcription factor DksA